MLKKFSITLDPSSFVFLNIVSAWFFSHFSLISLDRNTLFLSPKHYSLNLFTFPTCFLAQTLCSSSGMISFLFFIMHFIHLDIGFWGFSKLMRFLWNFLGWVMFKWSYMLMHCIIFAFSLCFMHLDVCFKCWNLVCW